MSDDSRRRWRNRSALAAAVLSMSLAAHSALGARGVVCTSTGGLLPEAGTWLSEGGGQGNIITTCMRPRVIVHQGEASFNSFRAVEIRWRTWGGARAKGFGYVVGCQTGTCYRNRVRLIAKGRAPLDALGCGPGRFYYRALSTRTKFGSQTVHTGIPQCQFTD